MKTIAETCFGRRIIISLICLTMTLPQFCTAAAAADFSEKPVSPSSVNETARYQGQTASVKKPDSRFAKAMANTSVRLLKETMRTRKNNKNTLISPDSILTAMTLVGSGAAGKTAAEMKRSFGGLTSKRYCRYFAGLHNKLAGGTDFTYETANSLWYRKDRIRLKPSFLNRAASFGADIYAAPFDTRTVTDMNSWVNNNTHGKIPSIINRLDPQTRTALINAVYFKGEWEEKYTFTKKRTFTDRSGTKKKVKMLEGTEHAYFTVNDAEGFVKDYHGGKLAFAALLPPENMTVDQYVKGLTGSAFIKGYKKRKTENILVYTRMPEFSYDDSISLEKPLRKLGVKTAFTGKADFSGISSTRMSIDEVLHKTHISVDKDGTEAAAVTAILMKATAAFPPQPQTIRKVYLNRPFVYAIIEKKTGVPLFIGVVKKI